MFISGVRHVTVKFSHKTEKDMTSKNVAVDIKYN